MTAVATRAEVGAANDYRLFLHVEDDHDAVRGVVDQLACWLRTRKNWTPRLDGNGFIADGKRDLLTIHRASSDGVEFRARLNEDTDRGVWRTQVTVQQPRAGTPWVSLTISNSEGRWVDVPHLASYLLDSMPLVDGETPFSSASRVVDPNGVDDLLDEICDPQRKGLYFVAGSRHDEIDFTVFADQVERWTRQVKGLAQVAILTPEATDLVREGLGEDHFVRPWTVRTYYPDVDPAIAADGLRHRYLTRNRLVEERDEEIRKLLGRIARRHAAQLPAQTAYVTADRALRRLENKLLVDAISGGIGDLASDEPVIPMPEAAPAAEAATPVEPTPPVSVEPPADEAQITAGEERLVAETESYLALIEMTKKALGLDDLTQTALLEIAQRARSPHLAGETIARIKESLDAREAEVESLKSELEETRDQYESMQIDERIAADRASKLEDEARWLRGRLAEAGDHQGAHEGIPTEAYTHYPADFDDLHSRMKNLATGGVQFTGDPSIMRSLDEHDTLGKLVSTSWDVLLVLADYLRARRRGICDGNVKMYLANTPAGYRTLSMGKFGECETKATMDRFGHEREFPVPTEVDTSGCVRMEAHFKLGKVGMVSPRLYYIDCFSTTGQIYIGYIGPHLTNTQTN